jgi:hypothetical protein
MLQLPRNTLTDRKLRLFACGCIRRIWHLLTDEDAQRGVELVEQYADGLATRSDFTTWWDDLAMEPHSPNAATRGRRNSPAVVMPRSCALTAALFAQDTVFRTQDRTIEVGRAAIKKAAAAAAKYAAVAAGMEALGQDLNKKRQAEAVRKEQNSQCQLLRDLIGNPFHPVCFDPVCFTPVVVSMARCIHNERDFQTMPILGDALEEAGCTNGDILDHCRRPGEHTLGCWVVDALLGKA